ncbi:uncharacterized protein LOC143546935 [Bidens hawaiensis]|uniref:uncharacterized protein LOC143546935 n=1 Tax=Bidens hawaiensis TaxID=980011 RepID=UPI00404AE14F
MKGLRKMKELRLLHVNDVAQKFLPEDDEVSQYLLPDTLQSLCWPNYPFSSLPEAYQANKLVNLKMCASNRSKLRKGGEIKVHAKLKFLDLSNSYLRTFDLRMTPHLEILNLKGCRDFVELQLPVECPNLKVLKLSGCKVSKLHLGLTPRLEKLILDGCKGFVELQLPFECWNLKVLNLSGSKVRNLNLVLTPHLEKLYLEECSYLQEIHAPVGCLKKLVYLSLSLCFNFAYFKVDKQHKSGDLDSKDTVKVNVHCVDVCPLHPKNNLPRFGFKCEYVEPRSSPSGNVEKLISFGPCTCENLEYILEKICDLQYLKELSAKGNVPCDLWRLESLEMLSLEKQQFQHLSGSICMLKHLKSLELYFCLSLEQLPENIHELESLEHLIILYAKTSFG